MNMLMEFVKQSDVYIYGAGEWGRTCKIFFDENQVNMKGFVVSDEKFDDFKHFKVLEQRVYSISEIAEQDADGKFVIAVSEDIQWMICEVLKQHNIKHFICMTQADYEYMSDNANYIHDYQCNKVVNVILYHRVTWPDNDIEMLSVTPEHFREHLIYLKEHYKILRFSDDWNCAHEKSVVITFDDGFADNFHNALPILEELEIPATFFITTGNIGTSEEFWSCELQRYFFNRGNKEQQINFMGETLLLDTEEHLLESYHMAHDLIKYLPYAKRKQQVDQLNTLLKPIIPPRGINRMMSEGELVKLSESPFVTIGAHTVTHTVLSMESKENQKKEIEGSKNFLQDLIKMPVAYFSYPFGGKADYSDETIRELKRQGFMKAVSGFGGLYGGVQQNFEIPRNTVRDWNVEEFARRLRRTYCIYG